MVSLRDNRGEIDWMALVVMAGISAIVFITMQVTRVNVKDVEFANEEIKMLQQDILELKLENANLNVRLDTILEGKEGWLKKIEDLSNLHHFLTEQNRLSRQLLSNGADSTSGSIRIWNRYKDRSTGSGSPSAKQ